MALTSTMFTFDVALSHVDRGVYESLTIKAACHPSETEEYFATRVLAYCLEYREGICVLQGDQRARRASDQRARPDGSDRGVDRSRLARPARLHKASKAAPRVAVYTHKEPRIFLRAYRASGSTKPNRLELYAMDRELLVRWCSDSTGASSSR